MFGALGNYLIKSINSRSPTTMPLAAYVENYQRIFSRKKKRGKL
jgi:hypothetical protein